jgi:hypothetical protein
LGKGLFPLTTEQQAKYLFKLEGRQTMNGRDVYRVSFRPKDKNDFDWKGEAFIDTHEFEPVVVYTEMSRKIPLAVRTLLGTNLPGLGFSVTYDREPDGVWFPVSFGTEFRMRVLFFIARDISMSLANAHFEKTHADVRILDGVKVGGEFGGSDVNCTGETLETADPSIPLRFGRDDNGRDDFAPSKREGVTVDLRIRPRGRTVA